MLNPVHLLAIIVFAALAIIPIFRIITRTGHSGWWSLVAFIPGVNWIFVWVFAYSRWPALERR